MLYAIIEHKNNTLIMEFPCRRMTMAEHFASVGIRTPAHEIKCIDEEDIPIKVKIFGESEFGKKLASVISAEDTLSLVNSFCEMYQNMPYANKQDIMEAVLQDKVASLQEFGQLMMQRREQDVMENASFGQNAFFYDAAEGLLTSSILLVAEFCLPETRHIVSVFKIIQDLLAPSKTKGKSQFQMLINLLPEEHKARWFAGAAMNTGEQAMASVMSTALSRLNTFLDSELEQILCFDTAIDAERFCKTKSAIFIVLPEEDSSKHFMVSLIVQQLYREILAVADEHGGKLPNRVMMYLDEFGTIPKISDAEVMFSASRSRRCSIVAIIQSFAQLTKNYGREGEEIIVDNTQLTVFGGFAPNSESAERLSKSLGTRTVQSGSISRGKNDPSQSLQMIERALMTPDELKSLPKGTFVVTKTGAYPMQVKLKLFFEWGIFFPDELYNVPDKGNRMVAYARKDDLQKRMEEIYPTPKKEEQKETAAAGKVHRPENNGRFHKPRQSEKLKENDISAVMEEAHDSAEEGEIYDEGVRDDIPG